jgi:hypothetical protein
MFCDLDGNRRRCRVSSTPGLPPPLHLAATGRGTHGKMHARDVDHWRHLLGTLLALIRLARLSLRPIVKSSGLDSVGVGPLSAGDACKDPQIVSKKRVSITFHRLPFVRCFVRSQTSNLCTAVTRYNSGKLCFA